MITIFLIENYPWVQLVQLNSNMKELGKNFGEWAWVGRIDVYDVDAAKRRREIVEAIKNERVLERNRFVSGL
jgi:hypothetical protein